MHGARILVFFSRVPADQGRLLRLNAGKAVSRPSGSVEFRKLENHVS